MNVFQAKLGGRFAPLTMLVVRCSAELDSHVTEFNKVNMVTDTATQLLGKQRKKRKTPGLLAKSLIVVTKGKI